MPCSDEFAVRFLAINEPFVALVWPLFFVGYVGEVRAPVAAARYLS
jgi:hypothetical protein